MYFFQKKLDHSHQILSNTIKLLPGRKTCSEVEEYPSFIQIEKMLGLKFHAK